MILCRFSSASIILYGIKYYVKEILLSKILTYSFASQTVKINENFLHLSLFIQKTTGQLIYYKTKNKNKKTSNRHLTASSVRSQILPSDGSFSSNECASVRFNFPLNCYVLCGNESEKHTLYVTRKPLRLFTRTISLCILDLI